MQLTITNNGPEIASTNFWETPHAHAGKVFLSLNAGCFRLLLPEDLEDQLAEMRTARNVVISRGPWPGGGKADAIEVLFDDGTDSPLAIHIGTEQVDQLPLDSDAGKPCKFAVYICGPARSLTLPARYRRSAQLPDLSP
jgi:hypothetical protein